jgi:membrane-bound lytic murein transglycosylase A
VATTLDTLQRFAAVILVSAVFMTAKSAAAGGRLSPVGFDSISGWQSENHAEALEALNRSCYEIIATGHGFKRQALYGGEREDWIHICEAASQASNARQFFEKHFRPFLVEDNERPKGLFTGYYEPEAEGSREQGGEYQVPVYRRPPDLVALKAKDEQQLGLKYGRYVGGKAQAYFTREAIEQGALRGKGLEIAYLKSWEDAFFIHVQGSGRIRLPDGGVIRLAYALKTGLPYTGIGGVLIERGILTRETNSMQSIRAWMKANPQAARELMWLNKSFVFFREIEVADPALGALGAQQVNLTPRRSLAVDRAIWMFGTPVWLSTNTPPEAPGGAQALNRILIAQDTGTAIKGYARGDVFWGWGSEAAQIAGHMKSEGAMIVLLPAPVAKRLGLVP